jgi:fructose-1-phosphate kinase PfkB-like protein
MDRLNAIFNSDALPIGILVLIVVEASVLVWWQRRNPGSSLGSPNTARVVSFLGAGGSLVAAMIFHRRDDPSPELFALAMLCALVLHLWHIAVLLRR